MRAGHVAAALGAALALSLAAAPARADHRDFAGKVSKVSEKRITVENRMGDRRSFVRGPKTTVKGGPGNWEGVRPGDEVIVDWHLKDQPPRARKIRVLPPPRR
jgi:hypothetical protein